MNTRELVLRIRDGDDAAREILMRRYRPRLERLAHGRLPASSRGVNDTQDLVQSTLSRALTHLRTFEHRHEGAFLAWLRTILRNEIIDLSRRAKRRPVATGPIPGDLAGTGPSPLEQAIGAENMEIYEQALAELPELQRQAVILRLEYGMSYVEIAESIDQPTPNAARMTTHRAVLKLADRMRELGGER